jgi:hypothetical protein
VSGRHAEGDVPNPLVPVALIVGIRTGLPPVDKAHADPHSWARSAERYAALFDRIDAGCSRDGRIPVDQAKEVVA